MAHFSVVGLIDDSSRTLHVASVFEGWIPARDASGTENVDGTDLSRYTGWIEADNAAEAENKAREDVANPPPDS